MSVVDAAMILGMVAVTYGVRAAPFLFAGFRMPSTLSRVLEKVPAAVLAALIVEPIFAPVAAAGSLLQPELLAALFCLAIGLAGAPMLMTVLLGMSGYWMLVWLWPIS